MLSKSALTKVFQVVGKHQPKSLLPFVRSLWSKTSLLNQKIGESHMNMKESDLNSCNSYTNKLNFFGPKDWIPIPKYRVLNEDGTLCDSLDPSLNNEKMIEMMNVMIKNQIYDSIMFECHRQGRISFYMTSSGEEASVVGSAAALEPQDLIFAQYREAGVLIYRGMTLDQMIGQCLGNCDDLGKGRQMPVHYGNRELNHVTISSTLTTQLPQAAGAAYAYKLAGETDRLVGCYFGEGAASEGDAHAAMNFAATLDCPVLFLCRNNCYSISTPVSEQYRGDGIASRAIGYGMPAIRVDGNDVIAVYGATRKARDIAIQEQRPVLVEYMTYRLGHHSSSDDSSAYRSVDELKQWRRPENEPISRASNYLTKLGLWSKDQEDELRQVIRKQVLEALSRAEKRLKLPISSMFEDVYSEMPANLERQKKELMTHLEAYGDRYPLHEFQK